MVGSAKPNGPLSLADAVRERRDGLGISQHELASLSGVDQGTISRIETAGRRPGRAIIRRLEAVLGPGLPRR